MHSPRTREPCSAGQPTPGLPRGDAGTSRPSIRGRGAAENPANRFDRLVYSIDPDADEVSAGADGEVRGPRTLYLRDPSRSALTFNQSPDIPFGASLNPYRGCEHGCIYCYARPTHEYLGFSAGLDFETRILVKQEAPELLRRELAARSWRPQLVGISGVTDPYQPIERRLGLTRRCLRVFREFGNPVSIITKSGLVARDSDILAELAAHGAASAYVSITTLDPDLHRALEPRASHPQHRLRAIGDLAAARVPVGVMIGPVIPGLNDHEIPAILEAAARAGARFASHIMLRLPHGVKGLFEEWLERHYPDRRQKVMNRIRAVRGGRLNDPRFGSRMRGDGLYAEQIHKLFELTSRRTGLSSPAPVLSTAAFRRAQSAQLALFD